MSEDLRSILSAALSPDEWKQWSGEPDRSGEALDEARRLVERWRTVVSVRATSPNAFEERLAALGLSVETAAERLLRRRLTGDGAAPSWAITLEGALSQPQPQCDNALEWAGQETPAERELLDTDRYPRPKFEQLVSPFVAEFRASAEAQREPAACAPVARSLLRRLSALCGRTVAYELRLERENGSLAGETSEARYREFAARRLSSPAARRDLLLRYPVLARMMATITAHFVDATGEVIERLGRDRSAIVSELLDEADPGPARLFYPGLSDMHCGGRTTWIIEFGNGSRVVYKPRDYSADRAYASVVEWLNAQAPSVGLRASRFVARDGYGWSEFMPQRDCGSPEAVSRYYRRQGFHAALVYFLCGQDFHAENFVADGEFPVPVDLEGLLSPGVAVPPPGMKGIPAPLMPLQFTIANSLMLPYWRGGKRERPLYVASGIGGSGNRQWPTKRPGWKNLNTDIFGLEFEWRSVEFKTSLPRLQGREAPVDVAAVEAGFREAWRIVIRSREELAAKGGALEAFRGMRSRYLFRDTQDYEDILFWTTAPDLLSSGAASDVALEMLAGSVPVFFTGKSFPELIDDEKHSLRDRDIPIAIADTSETDIRLPRGRRFGPVVAEPMFDQMITRLRSAADADCEMQCALIRTTLELAADNPAPGPRAAGDESRTREYAISIGHDLVRTMFRPPHHAGWLGLIRFPGAASRVYMVQTEPWSLNGDAGNALFLINLARATGERHFESAGRDALESAVNRTNETAGAGLFNLIGSSGYVGYFGLVYALAAAGVQLEDASLLQRALDLAARYPAEKIREERNPDLLTGAAGPAATLAWLHSLTQDPQPLLLARQFADAIGQCAVDGGRGGWQVPFFRRPLLGMAHGSAGIAAALIRLYRYTGDERHRDAALAGLAHERAHFQSADGQWPNLQEESGRIAYMTGWCAGAAGIGLGRLEFLKSGIDNPEIRADIEAAVAATRRNLCGIQHHACCGEAGRITFMMMASHTLNRPELRSEALAAAVAMLDQFESQGHWYLQEFCERLTIPGLLAGVPGVGMALLSATYPSVSGVLGLC